MAQIANNIDDNVRHLWSQHLLNNVYYDYVPLADPVHGIFGATPVETMHHALQKGIIEMVTFSVLDNAPASQKAKLDTLAVRFHTTHCQTFRKRFPATDFSNGITNLTKITAGERLGLVFLFVILAQYDEGCEILSDTLLKQGFSTLAHVLHVFEGMLCFMHGRINNATGNLRITEKKKHQLWNRLKSCFETAKITFHWERKKLGDSQIS